MDIEFMFDQTKLLRIPLSIEHVTVPIEGRLKFCLQFETGFLVDKILVSSFLFKFFHVLRVKCKKTLRSFKSC